MPLRYDTICSTLNTNTVAVLIFGLCLFCSCGVSLPGQNVATNGDNSVEYAVSGSGQPTIVLMSAIGDDFSTWKQVWKPLSELSTVLAYNRAGYGKSTAVPGNRSGEQIIAELQSLLSQLQLSGPLVLVAHNRASMYAELFARTVPEQVKGLVLIDPQQASFEIRCRNLLGEDACEPPIWRRNLWAYHVRAEYEFAGQTSEQILEAPPLGDMPLVTLSKTLGEESQLWRDLRTQTHGEMAAQSSNGRHRIIEDSGSYVQQDAPQAVIDAVREVVTAVR